MYRAVGAYRKLPALSVRAKAKRRVPGVKVPVAAPSATDAVASCDRRRRLRPRGAGKAWVDGRSAAASAGAGAAVVLDAAEADEAEDADVALEGGAEELGDD